MNEVGLGSHDASLKIAVIGSGPSGFYAVQALFKQTRFDVRVDLFDRLPTPFGLVRGGVAPDHQKIKRVIRVYEKTAADPRFRFFGNVRLGSDLTLDDFQTFYDATILATGNESDRALGIPGEELHGVVSATEFVGWYNGHPDFQDRVFDLENTRQAVVIGNGNVAMDVARILAKQAADLATTDVTRQALTSLEASRVQEISLLARRGPAQAAFSPKEIKELGEVTQCTLRVDAQDVTLTAEEEAWLEDQGSRDSQKNMAFLKEVAHSEEAGDTARSVSCRFLLSPVEFLGQDGRVTSVILEKNVLRWDATGKSRPQSTGEQVTIAAQLVLKAIGYRGTPIAGVPFDHEWGIIPNDGGRVLRERVGPVVTGLYVVGWAKRGPTGLIGTNSGDAQATVALLIADLEGRAPNMEVIETPSEVVELLRERGIDFVTWRDWSLLDAEERARGEVLGKCRDKFGAVSEMMDAIARLRANQEEGSPDTP